MEVLFFILIGAILAIIIPLIDYMSSNKNEYSLTHYKDSSNKQELQDDIKQQRKEKILNVIKIILIVLWNILKWTLLIGITIIVTIFSVLVGSSKTAGLSGERKRGRKKSVPWTTPKWWL